MVGTKKENVGEEYIKVIQDMYDGCTNISKKVTGINGEL